MVETHPSFTVDTSEVNVTVNSPPLAVDVITLPGTDVYVPIKVEAVVGPL
jgi:hypothetical protein